jgi:hypothetical protein
MGSSKSAQQAGPGSGLKTASEVHEDLTEGLDDGAGSVLFDGGGGASTTSWGMRDFTWHRFFTKRFVFPGVVRSDSQVMVSITELNSAGFPFSGAARLVVYNISPADDGSVTVKGDVVWDSDLKIRLNFVIVN